MSGVQRVVVEADGGSRGNPGPAGYGAVVLDPADRAVLAERRDSIGIATNNVAEYRGLIAGLTAAAELSAREVVVRMDSKLVVEQMSGRWKVKHKDMIPLAERARALVAQFDRVTFTWIPRAENAHADQLANEAMDGADALHHVDRVDRVGAPATFEKPQPPAWTGATGSPTRMLLLRHGQTELSVDRKYSGRGNPVLTALGRDQAAAAAKRIGRESAIATVISSPLGRALDTARASAEALGGLDVRVDDDLIETDFGDWEGLTFSEAAQRDPELHRRWLGDTSVRPPGGESFDEVRIRVRRALSRLTSEYPGQQILVVSHVTPIKTLLQFALDVGPTLLFRLHLDLASLSVADFYPDGGASVRLVNDTSYLAG